MMRTRVKICGIRHPGDARFCAGLGVDAIGLVFHPASPRAVSAEQARVVVRDTPAFVTTVGLFVDPSRQEVEAVLSEVALDCLQFHGDEPPDFCEQFGRPYIKAIRMREQEDLTQRSSEYASARALLLDTYVPGVAGGTGKAFDWARVPTHNTLPLILAGGLHAGNVGEAILTASPFAVDVSGGVESEKGVKDQGKIREFINEVNRVGTREI